MTKQIKFIVKIPIPQQQQNENEVVEYKTFPFSSIEDVATFLEITPNTLYSFRTKRLKLKHQCKKKLDGILIEKVPVYYSSKPNVEKIEKERIEFQQSKILL